MDGGTILVATDFSTRSDRALRRATLLAKQRGAALTLLHVVDDDQPLRIVEAEQAAAAEILAAQAETLRQVDGVTCRWRIVEGDPFEGIARAVEDDAPDLLVIGPHRRQALKDVFLGTTAERTIRIANRPMLMANGVPAGGYRHVLVAVDLSAPSAEAIAAFHRLGLDRDVPVSVLHVFDALATSAMAGAGGSEESLRQHIAVEANRAAARLDEFLAEAPIVPLARLVRHADSAVARVIGKVAREVSADLLVLGMRGQGGIVRIVLGSVALAVLTTADIDVLAVPVERGASVG